MERRHLAAASGHLHLAAAAYYMAKAGGRAPHHARTTPRIVPPTVAPRPHHAEDRPSDSRTSDAGSVVDVGGDGDNASDAASPNSVPISIDVGSDDDSISIDVGGDDDDGSASGDDGGGEEWNMQHLYDLLLLVASFVPPAPAYKALPRDVVEGLASTWIVLVYGVFLTVVVTTFSVRVFGTSNRCLPTFLRVLLLTATIVADVLAAVYMMPASTLTVVGASFTVVLLLVAHLFACRRCRR